MTFLQRTSEQVRHYLTEAIASFDHDPADSEFQRGYLAALKDTLADNFMTHEERASKFNEDAS